MTSVLWRKTIVLSFSLEVVGSHTHTHTSVLLPSGLCPGLPGWARTRTNLDFTDAETVIGSCFSLAIWKSAPCCRQIPILARCPCCRPTNSVNTLKAVGFSHIWQMTPKVRLILGCANICSFQCVNVSPLSCKYCCMVGDIVCVLKLLAVSILRSSSVLWCLSDVTYCVISSSREWNRTWQWLYYWYDVFTDQSRDIARQHSCAWCPLWKTVTARTSTGECFCCRLC